MAPLSDGRIAVEEVSVLQEKAPIWPVIAAALLVCTAWSANLFLLIDIGSDARGTFGDMFGGVNAAFSGLAFVGVIYAIFLQRHEIRIAHTEIAYTKHILAKQQDQLELQNRETRKQIFESTFFQLMRLLTEITAQIDLRRGGSVTKGKDVFPVFLTRLRSEYTKLVDAAKDKKVTISPEDGIQAYEKFYERHNTELGHYFRTIYNILKFIEASKVESKIENGKFYSNILRAQLSDAEVGLLFHNGLSTHGSEKFKPLAEKYSLLKNLSDDALLNAQLLQRYASSAFGGKR